MQQDQTYGGFTCEIWVEDLTTHLEVSDVTKNKSNRAFYIKGTNRALIPQTCVVDLSEASGANNPQRVAFHKAADPNKQKWKQPSLMTLVWPAPPGPGFTDDTQNSGVWKVSSDIKETIYADIDFTYFKKRKFKLDVSVDLK